MSETSNLIYIPTISAAYVEFLKENDNPTLLIESDYAAKLRPNKKDIRVLETKLVLTGLSAIVENPFKIVEEDTIQDELDILTTVVLPDDDVSRLIIANFRLPETVTVSPLFLRWNREVLSSQVQIKNDYEVGLDSINPKILESLKSEQVLSNDWWLQVAAYAELADGSILKSHNEYLPSPEQAEIDGDVRAHTQQGKNLDNYNAVHAEASIIAQAARSGTSLEGSKVYITHFPCPNCSKLVALSGVSEVYYMHGYAVGDGLEILKTKDVTVIKIEDEAGDFSKAENLKTRQFPVND